MKTPITDKAFADAAKLNPNPSLMKLGIASRRLELDRAALMEALDNILRVSEMGSQEESVARAALSAARANFPD